MNCLLTQGQANELYEGSRIDMADLVADTCNILFTTLFYCPLSPVVLPIAFLGLLSGYWVEKYELLRVHRMPEMLNEVIAMFMCNLLPYFTLIWAVAYFVIFDKLIAMRLN